MRWPQAKSSPLELLDRASRYEVWWSRGPSKSTRHESELVALKHVMVRSLLGTCSHSGDIPGTCRELMRIKLVYRGGGSSRFQVSHVTGVCAAVVVMRNAFGT